MKAMRFGSILLAVATTAALSACGGSDDSGATAGATTAASGAAKALKVGYSSKGSDQFQLILQQEVQSQIPKQGLSGLQPTASNNDPGKQIADIHTLVSQGANAILVAPGDSKAIKPAIDFLDSKRIPTVSLDTSPDGAKVAMVVAADNVKMGQDGCAQMGAWLKGKGTVLSMQGDYNTSSGRDRGVGFKSCMDKKFPGIHVIERPTHWQSDQAADVANTVLKTNKQIDGVYMASDTVMLSAVLSALKSAGRDAMVGQPGHVFLISIDGSPFGLQQVRAGKLDALLSQPLDLYAKYGVGYLKEANAGKTFKVGPTDHGSRIVTTSGNLTDLLPAPLVTKDNASDPSLWGNSK